jgi:perosamine synthetase
MSGFTGTIRVNTPVLDGNEKKYLMECIDTEWISSGGPFVKRFEDKMASLCNRKFAIACANGTAAIDIAVGALKIQKGDEIIVPSLTIISCVNELAKLGAKIVPVDCDESFNMNPNEVEKYITQKTKGIMIVHIYHFAANMKKLLAIAKKHSLHVIEDTAEMIGQTYNGKPCGSFGDISCMSFYPNKHITSGEGGMVLTDDENLANRCKLLRNLAFDPSGRRFIHQEIGWNYRMTNMQAAIGLAQAEKLAQSVIRKREIGHLYTEHLKGTPGVILPPTMLENEVNIYWVYGILIDDDLSKLCDAELFMKKLKEKGVDCRPFFWGIHEQPVLKKMGCLMATKCPLTEKYSRYGFYIPSGLGLTNEEIKLVSERLKLVVTELMN